MNTLYLQYLLLIFFVCISNISNAIEIQFAPPNQQANSTNYPQPTAVRDPFTPSTLMYKVIGSQNGLQTGAYGFIPSLQGNKIPNMKLRGFIEAKNSTIALLEIEGRGVYRVREGDEINIDPSNPRQAIRISKINRHSVTVETGTLGSIRVLR